MPSNYTEHYNLSQWERTDKIQMEDFNTDNAKIDAALKAEANARTAQTAALQAGLNKKGNCRIYTLSYTGDGACGADHPKTFTFPGKPLLVVISNLRSSNCLVLTYGATRSFAIGEVDSRFCEASWSGNSLFLTSTQSASHQMNTAGTPYSLVALFAADA